MNAKLSLATAFLIFSEELDININSIHESEMCCMHHAQSGAKPLCQMIPELYLEDPPTF